MRAITRTTLIFALLLATVAAVAPRTVRADDPAPPWWPIELAWTRTFTLGGSFALVPSDSRLLVILPEQVDAYAWAAKGDPLWTARVTVTAPPVVSDGRVFVAVGDEVQALSEVSGAVQWRLPSGRVSIAPTAQAGWLIAGSDDRRIHATSASDGRVIWQDAVPASLVVPMVIDGGLLVGAFDDGIIRSWNITDGKARWSRPTGTRPTHLLAARGHVFMTGENGRLISLDQDDGDEEWNYRLDMPVAGRLAADAKHVYVTTVDNSLRAHNYRGHQAWRETVQSRIVDGLFAEGGRVYVPQSNGKIQIFLADRDGTKAGELAAPVQAVATGGLQSMGSGATMRLVVTQAEQSNRAVSLFQTGSIPVTVATSAPGVPVVLRPPAGPSRP
jgi:outer membrane protein assembly factor BamB